MRGDEIPGESVKVARASLKLAVAETVNIVFGVFFFLVLTRLLNRMEMAAIAVMTVLCNFSSVFLSFGFHEASRKLLPGYLASGEKKAATSFLQNTWFLIITASFLCSVFMFLMAKPLARVFFKQENYVQLMGLIVWGVISNKLYETAQHNLCALQMFKEMSLVQILSYTLVRLYALGLYFCGGISGYLVGLITGQALLGLWMIAITRNYLLGQPNIRQMGKILRFSWPFYLNEFVRYGGNQADSLLVSLLLKPEVLATYYVVRRFSDYLESYINSLMKPLFPKMIELFQSSKETMSKMFFRATHYVCLVTLPPVVFMLALSYFLLDIYGKGKYLEGMPLFFILVGGMLFFGYQVLFGGAVFVAGRPVETTKMEISQSVVSLVLLIFLTRYYGVIGAATAKSLTRVSTILIAWLVGKRFLEFRFDWGAVKNMALVSVTSAGVLVALQRFRYSPPLVCLYILISLVLFVWLAARMLGQEDKELLKKVLPGIATGWERGGAN